MTIQPHEGSALTLASDQTFWTDAQQRVLAHICGWDRVKPQPADLGVFMHVSQRTGLDPFARQIHMVERQGKWTIQTGIDGFRLVARRAVDKTGETLSINGGEWCGPDGIWRDVWIDVEPPAAARVTVTRGAGTFVGTVTYRGYVQRKRDGDPMFRWATDPSGQLAKCAEAKALRMAFPMDLAGVYSDDEMQQADGAASRRSAMAAVLAEQVDPEDTALVDPSDAEVLEVEEA